MTLQSWRYDALTANTHGTRREWLSCKKPERGALGKAGCNIRANRQACATSIHGGAHGNDRRVVPRTAARHGSPSAWTWQATAVTRRGDPGTCTDTAAPQRTLGSRIMQLNEHNATQN